MRTMLKAVVAGGWACTMARMSGRRLVIPLVEGQLHRGPVRPGGAALPPVKQHPDIQAIVHPRALPGTPWFGSVLLANRRKSWQEGILLHSDSDFHQVLSRMTGNKVLERLLSALVGLLGKTREKYLQTEERKQRVDCRPSGNPGRHQEWPGHRQQGGPWCAILKEWKRPYLRRKEGVKGFKMGTVKQNLSFARSVELINFI